MGLQGCVINGQNVAISGIVRRTAGTKWLGEGTLYLLSDLILGHGGKSYMSTSSLRIERIAPSALPDLLRTITDIRMQVFSAWPTFTTVIWTTRTNVRHFQRDPKTVVIGAWDGMDLVGVSTASRWETHPENLLSSLPGDWSEVPVTEILYLAESVLYASHRGRGAGLEAFFDAREAFAQEIGRRYVAFAAVVRAHDDPQKPAEYRDLAPWWRRLGYRPVQAPYVP